MSTDPHKDGHPRYPLLNRMRTPLVAKIHAEARKAAASEIGDTAAAAFPAILREHLSRQWAIAREQEAACDHELFGSEEATARFAADMIDDTRRSRAAHAAIGGR